MDPPITWLCMTCGALFGGLAIRFIGFRDPDCRKRGFNKFLSTCLWLQNGIAVTAATTYFLKMSDLSVFFESHPTVTLVFTLVGLIKFYPSANLCVPFSGGRYLDLLKWIIFWQLPSLSFCSFDSDTLIQSSKFSCFLLTTCLTAGATVPLRDFIIEDLGIKIIKISIPYFIIGLILKLALIPFSDSYSTFTLLNSTLIVIISGLLIDDVQQIKAHYELEEEPSLDMDASAINKTVLRKSIPLFLECTFIFGRIAALIAANSSPKELEE